MTDSVLILQLIYNPINAQFFRFCRRFPSRSCSCGNERLYNNKYSLQMPSLLRVTGSPSSSATCRFSRALIGNV